MRKIWILAVITLCLFTLFGCGTKNTFEETLKLETLKLGTWGESQPLDFLEKDDGRVFVVNEAGDQILDISDYPLTEIICDENTKEPRVIKTSILRGTEEIEIETDCMTTVNVFDYNYFDTNGNLLVENSKKSIISIVDYLGFTFSTTESQAIFNLKSGKCLAEDIDAAYLSEDGFAYNSLNSGTIFLDANGKELGNSKGDYYLAGVIIPYQSNYGTMNSWCSGGLFGKATQSYGEGSIFLEGTAEETYTEEHEYYNLIETEGINYYLATAQKNNYFIFREYGDTDYVHPSCGLVNSKGDIMLEAKYDGFSTYNDNIIAYGGESTEIRNEKDLSLKETLPYKMTYYDGTNTVVQVGEYSFYLGDKNGNALTDPNNGVTPLYGDENYFGCTLPNSNDIQVVDSMGNTKFKALYASSLTPLTSGNIAIQSQGGFYSIDREGNLLEVYRLYEGFTYDEATNTISPTVIEQ